MTSTTVYWFYTNKDRQEHFEHIWQEAAVLLSPGIFSISMWCQHFNSFCKHNHFHIWLVLLLQRLCLILHGSCHFSLTPSIYDTQIWGKWMFAYCKWNNHFSMNDVMNQHECHQSFSGGNPSNFSELIIARASNLIMNFNSILSLKYIQSSHKNIAK